MDEIRCPLCGTLNPASLEHCQICRTQLKPSQVSRDIADFSDSVEPASFADPDSTPQADLPDWLRQLRETEYPLNDNQDDAEDFYPKDEKTDEHPDWLKQFYSSQEDAELYGSEAEVAQFTGLEENLDAEETPESEIGFGLDPNRLPSGTEEQAPALSGEREAADENLPDWLAEIEPEDEQAEPVFNAGDLHVPPLSLNTEDLQEFSFEEESSLPDWLSDLDPEKKGDEEVPEDFATSSEQGANPDLAPAEIPGWIESIRPVSTVIDPLTSNPEDRDEVVDAGPLAGLSGILPVEPGLPQAQKPPAYPLKVQVTDTQQVHAGLLDQILRSEAVAPPVTGRRVKGSQNFLRVLIALVLFMALPWAMVRDTSQAGLSSINPEIAAASQIIGEVQSGDPVLLAFDYEPGFTGEMDAIAASVTDHLMLKGAYVTIVSTTPTGPVQAERLLAGLEKRFGHTYQAPGEYINLGFIPGGPAGLLSFVESPRQTMPVALRGAPAWNTAPLSNVNGLSDFSLAVVITESPDTARAWIEQAQPALGTTPLIMAISAQAEPMIRPYYESGSPQVQGLISGLSGGASYEELIGRSGLASSFRSPFAVGMLAAGALVLLGGIANLAVGLLARRKVVAASEG